MERLELTPNREQKTNRPQMERPLVILNLKENRGPTSQARRTEPNKVERKLLRESRSAVLKDLARVKLEERTVTSKELVGVLQRGSKSMRTSH